MENIDLVFDTNKSPIKSTSEYIGITDIDNNFTTEYSPDGPLIKDKQIKKNYIQPLLNNY